MGALRSTMTVALGAAGMYWLDPTSGRRRRARARDAIEHFAHVSLGGIEVASRDLSHRLHGLIATARQSSDARPTDDVLAERVRAKMGRLCSHPHAVGVQCEHGRVTLGGAIVEDEARELVAGICAVPGVVSVEDRLERHVTADIPSLQGGIRHPTSHRRFIPAFLSPGIRLAVGGAGGLLATYGALRKDPIGAAAVLLGAAVVARSLFNLELGELVGVGSHARGVQFAKTMTIHAPIDEVFASFTAFETFPRFMRHVREVRKINDNRYHWKVEGPAGISFEWDGVVMQRLPNRFVSWTSAESTSVRHVGSANFEPAPAGTRMTIRMRYDPPAGWVGHELARLFGADPKRELDEDMLRFQSLVEHGKVTGSCGTVHREELASPAVMH